MLNKNKERELAYIVKIDGKEEIPGYDRIVSYRVGGWKCVAGKNDFQVGDLAVYIEIDSFCPYTEVFAFLDKGVDELTGKPRPDRHKIKTQKFAKGTALSQGLIMPLKSCHFTEEKNLGDFVTNELGIIYYEPEDNARKEVNKRAQLDKIRFLTNQWFKKRPYLKKWKWLYVLINKYYQYKVFHNLVAKKTQWPSWVAKTDEERCQNLPHLFPGNDKEWIATEKIDGTSTTFTMKQAPKKKRKLYVCSRNVVFDNNKKDCFYSNTEGNVYVEMANKYKIEQILNTILDLHPEYVFITIQGETYGGAIQKRNYGKEHRLAIFNIIYQDQAGDIIRLNPIEMHEFIANFGLEGVPIIDEHFKIPNTCEELLNIATGTSKIDGGMREGIVCRSYDGLESFKAVSNEFLLKYHN